MKTRNPNRFLLVLAIVIAVFALAGCAKKVKTQMLVPAKSHEAAKCKRIAVLDFKGHGGDQVRADLESLLVGVRVKDEPYFSVIERDAVTKVLQEQMLHQTGVVDAKTATDVGKMLGADGIVMGVITQDTTQDKGYSEKRSKCAAKNKKGKCKRWTEYTVSCTERTAYFSFTPKIVRVSSGEILSSEVLSGLAQDRECRDSGRALADRQTLLARAKSQAIEKFREVVAPYYVSVEIVLITKDDTDMSTETKKKIKKGVKWVEAGRLDRACEFWNQAYDIHQRGYALNYLLGVCSELSGNLENALSCYQNADRQTASPNEEISKALGRVKVNIEKQKKLSEQLSL
jgi:curli biogenesis system outer membrane secretion channel CsgG